MSWRYSAELGGAPAGWSTRSFATSREALRAGRDDLGDDEVVWTAWVSSRSYADQRPPATVMLAEMRERAAERGADTSCFDLLEAGDVRVLDDLLRRTLENWERWLPEGKRSAIVVVENVEKHKAVTSGGERV